MATVLVTGANRGIGLALVREYLSAGDTVIATCRTPEKADELNATGAEVHPLEVTDAGSISALKTTLGDRAIDLLINNAGVGGDSEFGNLDTAIWEHVLEVNTIAPLKIIEALQNNVEAGSGRMIANISSQMGSIDTCTASFGLIYRSSKAALNMALRAAAHEVSEKGITLLTLHPGWVQTDMGGKKAPVSPEDSAAGLRKVIAGAGPAKDLRFMDYQGKTLPW